MSIRLRSHINVYFTPTNMSYRKLPTYLDIYKHYLFLKPCSDASSKKKTVLKLIDIWNRASLPIFTKAYITAKLAKYIEEVKKLKKSISNDRFEYFVAAHKEKYDKLFDICPCKCEVNCRCPREYRIPTVERQFLIDQRTVRIMTIDCSSTVATAIQSRHSIAENSTRSYSR